MIYSAAMVIPSPRPLAELLRSHRRAYLAVILGGLVYLGGQAVVGWYVRESPDVSAEAHYLFGLGWIMVPLIVMVAVGGYYLARGRHRERTAELLVTPVDGVPAFVVPAAAQRWSHFPLAITGGWIAQLGLMINTIASGRGDAVTPALAGIWVLMIALCVGWHVVSLRRGSQRLVLTATGVSIPTFAGSRTLAWTSLAPGGPLHPAGLRQPIMVRFYESPYELRFFSGIVRPDLVADLIRHYVEHPAQRHVIGTPEEYARLQVTARLESIAG